MLAGRSSQTEGPATLKLLIVLLESNTSAVRVAVAGLPRLVTMRYSVVLTNRTGVALGGIAQVSADGVVVVHLSAQRLFFAGDVVVH